MAGETAAALAAASIVYREAGNTADADVCLQHAQQLFDFADQHRASYTGAITDAAGFYQSHSGYSDELIWAAAWIAKATGEQTHIDRAVTFYNDLNGNTNPGLPGFSWDNKYLGAQILMHDITGDSSYGTTATSNFGSLLASATFTPAGFMHLDNWGSARYVSNAAYLVMQAKSQGVDLLGNGFPETFATNTIDYLKGANPLGMSYIIGYGANFPQQPHHRGSSCPASGACGWTEKDSADPNPMVIFINYKL